MTKNITVRDIAKMIDHSLLHPTFTDEDIKKGCEIARKFNVATVCVKPYSILQAKELLKGSDVAICAVIGFPHGNSSTEIKVAETIAAVKDGATEVDMVVNIGKVLSGEWEYVEAEIKAINDAAVKANAILKVIFENDYLDDDADVVRLCEVCSRVGVAYVKTSTGYGFIKQSNGMYTYHGATEHHLKLMREHCAKSVKIKAAGGVRTLDDTLKVRALGVSRIGATATEAILNEAISRGVPLK